MSLNRCLTRTGIAGLAVGVASVLTVSAAPSAGAATSPTTAQPAEQPARPSIGAKTPMCLVGAAVFYPLFLGNVILTDPAALPSAAPGFWTGGDTGGHKAGPGDHFHGWLSGCGLPGGA
jgi:hypothetical protein